MFSQSGGDRRGGRHSRTKPTGWRSCSLHYLHVGLGYFTATLISYISVFMPSSNSTEQKVMFTLKQGLITHIKMSQNIVNVAVYRATEPLSLC